MAHEGLLSNARPEDTVSENGADVDSIEALEHGLVGRGVLFSACLRYNRWDFLLVAPPLRISAGTGSPVNPLAIF
jgi:hypothetical protein